MIATIKKSNFGRDTRLAWPRGGMALANYKSTALGKIHA
jgi:hypoxanthine phosphoribosyltransferase